MVSFLRQGLDCELQLLTMFFMSLGVVMVITDSQSYRGIQPMSLGNQLEALLLQDLTMQLLQSTGAQFGVQVLHYHRYSHNHFCQKCPFSSVKKWHFERPDIRTESKNLAKHPPNWLGRHLVHAFPFLGEYQAIF